MLYMMMNMLTLNLKFLILFFLYSNQAAFQNYDLRED